MPDAIITGSRDAEDMHWCAGAVDDGVVVRAGIDPGFPRVL